MWLGPGILLRLEGLFVAVGALALYSRLDGNWLLFLLLILGPDVSMLGYLAGTRVGAGSVMTARLSCCRGIPPNRATRSFLPSRSAWPQSSSWDRPQW